jgi:transcription elongation GreA/GreB family factor
MSRAFVKEIEDEAIELPDRPVSPHPNFVTEAGRLAIETALNRFEAAHKAAIAKGDRNAAAADLREIRYWRTRLASAQVVEPPADTSCVRFGSTVTVKRRDGREQTLRIVGEDEANPSRGTISYVSPLARAVIGRTVGETIEIASEEAVLLKIG